MRGTYYIYASGRPGDNEYLELHVPWTGDPEEGTPTAIPMEVFDQLVVMRMAEILFPGDRRMSVPSEGDRDVAQLVSETIRAFSGNGGCAALCRLNQRPDWLDELKVELSQQRGKGEKDA
jgi:hypothetical protein